LSAVRGLPILAEHARFRQGTEHNGKGLTR
jgi:hypothetical protein